MSHSSKLSSYNFLPDPFILAGNLFDASVQGIASGLTGIASWFKTREFRQLHINEYQEIFKQLIKMGEYKTIGNLCLANKQINQCFKSRCAAIFRDLYKEGIDFSLNNQKALQWATRNGHNDVFKILLQDPKVDPSVLDPKANDSMLLKAVQNRDIEGVKVILSCSSVRFSPKQSQVIEKAIEGDFQEAVILLLNDKRISAGIDLNKIFKMSIEKNHIQTVALLLEKIDPWNIWDALRKAMSKKYLEMVKLFVQSKHFSFSDFSKIRCMIPYEVSFEVFKFAAENNCPEIIECALKNEKVDPSARNNALIRWACEEGHLKVVQLLLRDRRVNPLDTGDYRFNAFELAYMKEHLEVVKLLLQDERVDEDTFKKLVEYVSEKGYLAVIKLLLQDKRIEIIGWGDGTTYLDRALQIAADYDHIEIVKLLLQDDRTKPFSKWYSNIPSRVISFSKANHLGILKLLIQDRRWNGGNLNNGFYQCFKWAITKSHRDIIELALQNESISRGLLLGQALKFGDLEVVRLLLKDEKIDLQDIRYVISDTIKGNHLEIMKLLVQDKRFNHSSMGYAFEEILEWVASNRHLDVLQLILQNANVDRNGVIDWMYWHNHTEVIKLLLPNEKIDPMSLSE